MHELSIALSIIDIASKQASEARAKQVKEVELDIGTLAGIEFESLEFALSVAVKDTLLEDTHLRINRIDPQSECLACHHIYTPNGIFGSCPECQEFNNRLLRGKELQIKSLLIE